jgi:putative transposase
MSRPLRIEFPGAVYHVTSRGDRREPIYRDEVDRQMQLDVLAQAMDRFDAQVLAYCLMGNHYHLVLHTRQGNLSRLMRHFNGVYTQAYNRRHGLVGHLFQGRFKAILVDRDAYLLALCRYVERNPVAAGLVASVGDWDWSSYRAHVGRVATPLWLDSAGLHGYLLGHPVASAADTRRACERYAALVEESQAQDSTFWRDALQSQMYLGDEAFVQRMQAQMQSHQQQDKQIPKQQRRRPQSWSAWLAQCHGDRDQALYQAYQQGGMTMTELGRECGLSVTHVSRLIARVEKGNWEAL